MSGDESPSGLLPGFVAGSYLLKFVVALFAVLLVVGLVSFSTYAATNTQLTGEAQTEYVGVAEQSATQIEDWRESRADTTRMLTQFEVIKSGTQAERQAFLQQESSRFPNDVARVHLVNLSSGTIVASTDEAKQGAPLNSREAPWQFGEIDYNDEGVFISSASEIQLNSTVSFVSAVETDGGGELVVVMQTNMDAVASDLPTPGDAVYSQVVDADSRVVAGTQEVSDMARNDGSLEVYSQDESPLVARGLDGASGFLDGGEVKPSLEGEYVVAYAPVEGEDWVVATHVPRSSAYALRGTITQRLLVLSGTTLLGLGLVGVVFGRGTVRALNRLTGKAERLEAGDLDVDLSQQRRDEFGRLTGAFANMRDSLRHRIQDAEAARAEAEQSRAEALEMNEYLEAKAAAYSDTMQQAADGDLTQRMAVDEENEAMDRIATEFNAMLAEIEETVASLRAFAGDVAEASEEVTESATAVQTASEQVTESMQGISEGADRQNESLQSVSGEMEQLSTTTEEIAASSNAVADLAERTANTGRRGREAAEAAIDGLAELETDSESAVAAIEALEAEMAEIDELIEFIGGLAKETNMLALNANIEASRGGTGAGEGGDDGFAVVAEEVKSLAEETKEAAEDIEGRLERIQARTDTTAEEVQRTADRVAEHTESVQDAAAALDEVADYAQRTNEGVQEISAATQQQAASTEEVVAMVDDAATISEETTAEAETVAAAAEEQTSSLSQVTDSAGTLTGQATQLSRALGRFETDAEASATDALDVDDGTADVDVESVLGDAEGAAFPDESDAAAAEDAGDRSDGRTKSADGSGPDSRER